MNALGVTNDIESKLEMSESQVSHILDRLWENERSSDQSLDEKIGDIGRVIGVAFTNK